MSQQEIQIDTRVEGLRSIEALTKAIDKLTENFEALGKNADKAADQVDSVNKSVKKTQKAADKGGVEIGELSEKFSKMGGAGGAAAGAIEKLGVVMSGPLGVAIAGAVVALGTVVVAVKAVSTALEITKESVKSYVQGNSVLKKSTEGVSKSLLILKDTFGAAVIGGEGFKKALTFINQRVKAATKFIRDNADTIFSASKKIANAVLIMMQVAVSAIATIAMGVVAPFDLALTALHEFREKGLRLMSSLLDNLGPALVQFGLMTQQTLDAQQAMVRNTLNNLEPYAFNMISKLHSMNKAAQEELKTYRQVIKELEMGPLNVGTARRTGGGGGAAPGAVPRVTGAPTARVFGTLAPPDTTAAGLAPAGPAGSAQPSIIPALDVAAVKAEALATVLKTTLRGSVTIVAEGMLDLAQSTAQAMGAFTVGVGNLSEFGDAVLDLFGNLSAQLGEFFIKTGIGMAFLSPLTGAGLIAAGLGLQVLSGYLGAKGSGNAGSGSAAAGGGSAGTDAVTREIQRSLRGPTDTGSVTNIEVVIAGRAIEPEMVTIIDDIARLNRSRALRRLGA